MPVTINGTTGIAGVDGSAGTPAVQGGDTNTGIAFPAADVVSIATNGTERLRVDSAGNVGIGASPSARFDVTGADDTNTIFRNTSAVFRIRPFVTGLNYTQLAALNSAGSAYAPLAVGGSITTLETNGIERMRIDSSGRVLVGTSSTFNGASNLQIASSLNEQIAIRSTAAAAGRCWRFTADNNNTTYIINQDTVGVYIGNGGTSWSGLSDERSKDIIEPISDAASKVASLRAVIGKYKTDEEGKRRSFLIAQDVQAVLPEAVSVADQETGYLGLSYTDTIPLLTAALQEALTEISSLKARVAALEAA